MCTNSEFGILVISNLGIKELGCKNFHPAMSSSVNLVYNETQWQWEEFKQDMATKVITSFKFSYQFLAFHILSVIVFQSAFQEPSCVSF